VSAFLLDLGRLLVGSSACVGIGAATYLGWRGLQRLVPPWRDEYGPLSPLSVRERRWVLALRWTLIPPILGSILLTFFWVIPLPLLVFTWRMWLDAGRVLRSRPVRGWWLELGCHFVVLGLGTILVYSLLTGFNRVTATGAAWGTVGVAVVLVYARTAQIAEGQRRESATSGVSVEQRDDLGPAAVLG